MPATLSALADTLRGVRRGADVEVVDASHDSRQVAPGWLFCAIPGAVHDGHDHAAAAQAQGASALLVQRWLDLEVPQVRVDDVRAATGPAAALVHGRPSDTLDVVGITGTNGKTTTAYLLESAFAAAGRGAGLIGTVEARVHGTRLPGVRTTPEGTDLQRLLAMMRTRGVEAVAMEVSSHGLALHRVAGTHFRVAVFTNLSQDHLDFHADMEDYFAAKAALFTPRYADVGIVCVDDDWGRRLAAGATIPTTTFGTRDADVVLTEVRCGLDGSQAVLAGAGLDAPVVLRTPLVGDFNVRNAAAAWLAARAAGVPGDAALAGIAACRGAPGRLERVSAGQPFTVLVDYAHTPDAVASVIATLRPLLDRGRLLVVLGAGGDRDAAKRPFMGAAAMAADVAVLTSDNPRSEDPDAILAAIRAGAERAGGAELVVEVDRRRAIAAALDRAGPGDVVLVAGKGHETMQELAAGPVPFDDRRVVAELVAAGHGAMGGAA